MYSMHSFHRRTAAGLTLVVSSIFIACAMPHASPEPTRAPATPAGVSPGHVVTGEFTDATGARAWRLWVPAGDAKASRPLVVMLHGCTQDPDDIARGTRLDALADSAGAMVLYPAQPVSANPKKCWNWYEPAHQRRDAGEPAAIAALTRKIQAEYGADPARTSIAGISAGGAMALITAAAYPELYSAVGVHSALPWGAAANVMEALTAMSQGAERVPAAADRITGVAFANAMGARARMLPAIVLYGADDKVVNAANGDALVRQLMDAYVQLTPTARWMAPVTDTVTVGGRSATRTRAVGGNVEGWRIAGLGHAWSGGSTEGTFTDAAGPDATTIMLQFLLAHPRASTGAGR
jgi:poly(hydroxyalkanoate) depolymerase family esterase